MSDASSYFAIRTLSLTTGGWTPVVAPMNCNYWVVRCPAGNILICSDQSNPSGTQDTLPAGFQEGVLEKQSPLSGTRYPAGTVFCYVQAVGGPLTAIATFAV